MDASTEPAPPLLLVVDDERRNRAVLRGHLSAAGYRVTEAKSGDEAMHKVASEAPDVVLLDVMMPDTNGFDVCRRIKEMPHEALLPVMLVTSLDGVNDKNAGFENGADEYLVKPVDRRQLLLRVRGLLRLREQDKFIHKQVEELRRLQAAKDDLVSLLVHDMRSPLAGQISLLQIVLDDHRGPEHERLRKDVGQALAAAHRVADALEEALRVRLLEEERLPILREKIELAALLREAVETVDGVARRRGVQVSMAVEGDQVISADPRLLRRSLENLLSNGLKYTSSGGDVEVRSRSEGGQIEIEVADRGPGVPDELKAVMFEKFGSLEARKGKARRGIGLGLYMVRLVAEGHGGTVEVRDRPGGGAVFALRLPRELQ